MTRYPLVSVIIPTFNSARFITNAIESVLTQTYKNIEIIVIDDGSTDETKKTIEPFAHIIQYYYQNNQGASAARQAGVERANGDYIAALDADDLWLPGKLEYQIQHMNESPEAGLCYCDGYRWLEGSDLSTSTLLSRLYGKGRNGWQFNYFFKIGAIATSSMVFKKTAIEHVGGYNQLLKWGDFELCARICAYFPAVYVDKPLMVYRVHANNTSSQITSANVIRQLKFKREARLSALSHVPEARKDMSVKLFAWSPTWLQMIILLIWRILFSTSKTKIFLDLFRYMTKLPIFK